MWLALAHIQGEYIFMKKKLAALLMSAALIVPAGAVMLTGCGGNKGGGGSEEHHEQEVRIESLMYHLAQNDKFTIVNPPNTEGSDNVFKAYVEVRRGVVLQESDFAVSATVYPENSMQYDVNTFTVDDTGMQYGEMTWVPDEDLYTVWTTYGDIKYNHVIRYTYDTYTLDLYVRVLPEVINLTSTLFTDVDYTTFSFEDVLTSTTQDEGGKYIDIIDKLDAAQANDELKLAYLESQGLITIGRGIQGQTDPETGILIDDTMDYETQTYHDVTRAYHANSSGNGINYKYTITAAPGYSIRFTENGHAFEDVSREFYWHIDSIDIDVNNYQLSNTNLVFNPSQTQHPTVTFNSDTTLPADLLEYENCAYWAGSYNSIGVCIRGTYQRDYGFVSGDEAYYLVNIEQAEDWWTIAPLELDNTQVKFAGNPPTTSYTTTYTGSAIEPQLSYSALTAIVDIFEAAYANNVDVTTQAQAQAKLVIKNSYTLVVDGEPHDCNIWDTYYIGRGYGNIANSIVWNNAEQGVTHYEDLVLPFTITKADYTFQTQNLQVHMTYDEDMTQETFATLVGNLGYYGSQTLEWDLDVQNELSSNGEFGYDDGRCVYVLKPGLDISMDVGTRTFVAQYYHDINNYNVTEITITLTVNKIQVYPILYWNYSWQGYTYTGSAQTVPYLTQSQEEHEFGITYQTFAAVEESEDTWVPTGDALESVVNAGRYITIATITSEAHYEPVGVSEGNLQYVWYVNKAQAYTPLYSLTHDNGYDSVLSGNYYGEYQKPTSTGYTTVKNLFTYYTGSAKTITLNNYYATGAGHQDYWTEVTLTHEYSTNGTTNWTSKTAEQLSAVGYYRTTLTFVCDDNHVFDNETNTASDTLEWRIITNTIAVDSINFNSVTNVYEAREVGNILPTLPANAVPEYLDLTYTRYYWSTYGVGSWEPLESGRDNTAGTYKVVATVKAIPGYDGADGVTYTKNSQAQAGAEYTAELEYTVNLAEGTLPAELESGDLILAYHYAVNDTIDTWDKFARNIHVSSSDLGLIEFDNTVIIADDKTSNNIIYNFDVPEEDRIWQYSGAITIVDAYRDNSTQTDALAIANHTTTNIAQDGYWTLVMSYTRNSGVYTTKEFTVSFYIAPMPDETPDYLIDPQDSDKLTLKLTYEYTPNRDALDDINALEYLFGNISRLIYADASHRLHFDDSVAIHNGDTSLDIAQYIDTTWGHYTQFDLVDHDGSEQTLFDAINAYESTTLVTYVNYTLDSRIWQPKVYKIEIEIGMRPTLKNFSILLSGTNDELKVQSDNVTVWDMDFDDESTLVLVPTGANQVYVSASSIYASYVDITYENQATAVSTSGQAGDTGESTIIITAKEGYEFANGVTQMVINLKWKVVAN